MPAASPHLRALAALTLAFVLSQFYRGCLAVIAPELQQDLNLSPAGFGTLSSAFFLAFGLAQVPVGIAFDRWGVGRPTRWLLLIGALSGLLFAVAPNGPTAMLAQAGLGLACAPVLMGLMHYTLSNMSTQRSMVVVGRSGSVAMVGALAATAPLGWAAHTWGWRAPLWLAAALMALACVAVWRWVKDEGHTQAQQEAFSHMVSSTLRLLRQRNLWTLIPFCVALAAGTAFRNAWGGPYFADVFGLSAESRGWALAVLSGVGIISSMALPALARRTSIRGTLIGGAVIGVVAASLLAMLPDWALAANLVVLTVLVSVGMLHALVMAHGRELLPAAQRGRGLGVLNSFVFLGSALTSWLFGLVAHQGQLRSWSAPDTYSAIFGLAALLALAGLLPYLRSPVPASDAARRNASA